MNSYERLFGAGPRGAAISIVLLVIAYFLKDHLAFGEILSSDIARYLIVVILWTTGSAVTAWSLMSLPPKNRGVNLVTTGVFKCFRHPLYAAFLWFFNMGFALLLNNWIYLVWAVVIIPFWSLNVRSEERLMKTQFGEQYEAYCRGTWRFFPKVW